jgi:hypothetical protein
VSDLYFGAHVSWSVNSDKDFAYFEIKSTTTNSDAAVDYIWFPANGSAGLYQTREPFFDYYRQDVQNGHVRIRAVNRSGTTSAWYYAGNIASFTTVIGGNMSLQNKTDVNTTGIKTGAGSSTRQVNVVYEINDVVTLTGGGTTEEVNISLTNRGFSTKPDDGLVVVEDVLYQGFYDSQVAGSTSTNAVVKIYRNDGGTLASGGIRFSARFTDYT